MDTSRLVPWSFALRFGIKRTENFLKMQVKLSLTWYLQASKFDLFLCLFSSIFSAPYTGKVCMVLLEIQTYQIKLYIYYASVIMIRSWKSHLGFFKPCSWFPMQHSIYPQWVFLAFTLVKTLSIAQDCSKASSKIKECNFWSKKIVKAMY